MLRNRAQFTRGAKSAMSHGHKRNRSEPISPEHRAEALREVLPAPSYRITPLHLRFEPFRRSPEWSLHSAKLVAGTLDSLLLLAVFTLPNSSTNSRGAVRLRRPMMLHQTVSSTMNLSVTERKWRQSWEELGFQLQISDDARCRDDVVGLSYLTGNPDYLAVYDALETGVQRSDMWRYTALYLYGGVYADVDVVAKPPMAELLNSLCASRR